MKIVVENLFFYLFYSTVVYLHVWLSYQIPQSAYRIKVRKRKSFTVVKLDRWIELVNGYWITAATDVIFAVR